MSKFCPNCGAALEDAVMFCGSCGTKLEEAPAPATAPAFEQPAAVPAAPAYEQPAAPAYQQPAAPAYQQPAAPAYQQPAAPAYTPNYEQPAYAPANEQPAPAQQKPKSKKGLKVFILLLLLAVGGYFVYTKFFAAKEKPYADALDNYLTTRCMYESDDLESVMPPEAWENLENEQDETVGTYQEYMDSYHDYFVEELEYEFGDNLKFSYEVTNEEKVASEDLEIIKVNLEWAYGISADSVSTAYLLKVDITIKGSDDTETNSMELYAIKIDSKWYIAEPSGWDDSLGVSFLIY